MGEDGDGNSSGGAGGLPAELLPMPAGGAHPAERSRGVSWRSEARGSGGHGGSRWSEARGPLAGRQAARTLLSGLTGVSEKSQRAPFSHYGL